MGTERQWRLPIGSAGGERADAGGAEGLYLDLLTAPPPSERAAADTSDPFVLLGPPGPFSRTVLACVAGPAGRSVRELALEMQSDEYPAAERSGLTNPDVERLWDERWRLWNLAGAADAAPAVVDVLPASAGGAPRLPPTLYCTERRAFFVPPCPLCQQPLQTCRDDAVLSAHGLPAFSQSLARFLHCPRCAAEGRAVQFYSLLPVPRELRARAPVLEQRDLYRAFAAAARAGGPLPCAGCARVPTCYPESEQQAGDAVRLLTPLSFHDCRCLPVERLGWTYGAFVAVLGGAPLDGEPDAAGEGGAAFEARYGQRRYLFDADPRGKLPLEILRLKLMLFAQLTAAVSRLHRATRLPHLGLSPAAVLVDVGEAAADVPRLYNVRTRVIGVGDATPGRALAGLAAADVIVPLLDPPLLRDTTFVGSLAQERQSTHDAMLAVRSVTQHADGRCRVTAEVTCESLDAGSLGEKDLLLVSLSGRAVRLTVEFAAYARPAGGQRAELASLPTAVGADALELLRGLAAGPAVRATFTVHPCLHVPADLQSLGLMLFTTVAANAEQGPGAVTAAVRNLSETLVRMRRDDPSVSADAIEERAFAELRRLDEQGVLARRQLFHQPSRQPDPSAVIPDAFWFGALELGMRAVTQLAGFGLCRTHDDFDPEHPEGPVDHLRAELGVLTQKIDAELLGRHGMRTVFGEALARVQRDATRTAAGVRARGGQVR